MLIIGDRLRSSKYRREKNLVQREEWKKRNIRIKIVEYAIKEGLQMKDHGDQK